MKKPIKASGIILAIVLLLWMITHLIELLTWTIEVIMIIFLKIVNIISDLLGPQIAGVAGILIILVAIYNVFLLLKKIVRKMNNHAHNYLKNRRNNYGQDKELNKDDYYFNEEEHNEKKQNNGDEMCK